MAGPASFSCCIAVTAMSRFGCGKGSGARRTALSRLKMAVVAPMPRASVRTTLRVNAGVLRSWRRAKRRSEKKTGEKAGEFMHSPQRESVPGSYRSMRIAIADRRTRIDSRGVAAAWAEELVRTLNDLSEIGQRF